MTAIITDDERTSAATRNVEVWLTASRAMQEGRIDDFVRHWTPTGRYEVAYPVIGVPPVVEGHAALHALFTALTAAATSITVHDLTLHQTVDPDRIFVEERMVADLVTGGRYENLLALRVTFRDGAIHEVFEYYGQTAHTDMLVQLGIA